MDYFNSAVKYDPVNYYIYLPKKSLLPLSIGSLWRKFQNLKMI